MVRLKVHPFIPGAVLQIYFNSKMVRLKVKPIQPGEIRNPKFQFQNGSIKSFAL